MLWLIAPEGQLSPSTSGAKHMFPSNGLPSIPEYFWPCAGGGDIKVGGQGQGPFEGTTNSTKSHPTLAHFPVKMTQPIEITHEWTGQQWDWPLQHNDGVVRVHDLPDRWEVGIDVAFFTPNEIEVKVVGDHLNIHCKHESRDDVHGSVSREINRSYKLPDTLNPASIKSHLTQNGVLRVTAQKK